MLTPKEERYCQNLEVLRMSQRAAYKDAYPNSNKWKDKTVDERACVLANKDKILTRRKEIRDAQAAIISDIAKWKREDAYKKLMWLIDKAQAEIENGGEITSPCVSAIVNATKELNTIFAVAEKTEGQGVLEDILAAVKGVNND